MDDFDDEEDDFLSNVDIEKPSRSTGVLQTCITDAEKTARATGVLQPCKRGTANNTETSPNYDLHSEFDDDDEGLMSLDLTTHVKHSPVKEPEVPVEEVLVKVPDEFPFPFEPYNIQQGFMKGLYTCLELGKVGIFESPTGTLHWDMTIWDKQGPTVEYVHQNLHFMLLCLWSRLGEMGKSLSLICGALRWLKDYQERQRAELEALLAETSQLQGESNKENSNKKETNAELDWISDFKMKQETEEKTKKIKDEYEQRLKKESKISDMKRTKMKGKRKRVQLEDEFDDLMKGASTEVKEAFKSEMDQISSETRDLDTEDDDLVLAEYHSDDGEGDEKEAEEEDGEQQHCTKIYFCSRTHSQLSQFVREVIKSPYGEDTRVVSLGSRQNMCVNETVRRLKSLSLINDTCRDLLNKKAGKKASSDGVKKRRTGASLGCPYHNQDRLEDYRDATLVDVHDIEQLVSQGQRMKACPYFGTRLALPDAEIVALPYNTLLHKSTREASGIKLDGNIVIIDEAHNLLETINSVHSTEISGGQMVRAHSQLSQYEKKYRSRLKASNLMYIKQILYILANLVKALGGKMDKPADQQMMSGSKSETKLWTINDFLFHYQLDNVNMFKIQRYCQKSLISRKLNGFVEKYQPEAVDTEKDKKEAETSTSKLSNFLKSLSSKGTSTESQPVQPENPTSSERKEYMLSSPLMHIEGFLLALTTADRDGRIVISKQSLLSQCTIKFLLLNPAVHFAGVIKEARSVIVAGGTMQPISEFKDQLFHAAGVTPERILEYSCGHVIPSEQLLPIAMTTGPTGQQLDFTYQNRRNPELLDELGRLIQNVCKLVPGGVICFFPSYEYEKFVYNHWDTTGTLAKIAAKKKVFREPKRAGQVDQVLNDYSSCIQNCPGGLTGSILFCVVGGKMSEGINFSDDLGRCVLMVGMPYPNINSPELKEKMAYLNANFPKDSDGRQAGQVHYENLCMKAVNQSIGRAIRHQGDYATILLLDRRYARASTVNKLPAWISKHLHKMEKFGAVFAAVSKFFSTKKKS